MDGDGMGITITLRYPGLVNGALLMANGVSGHG